MVPRNGATRAYDIVGPVCETGDFLGKDRAIFCIEPGDLLLCCRRVPYGLWG